MFAFHCRTCEIRNRKGANHPPIFGQRQFRDRRLFTIDLLFLHHQVPSIFQLQLSFIRHAACWPETAMLVRTFSDDQRHRYIWTVGIHAMAELKVRRSAPHISCSIMIEPLNNT